MKGRNFSKALKRGSSKVIRRKRKLDPAAPPTDREEERPHWDNICISSDSEAGESERVREGGRKEVHPFLFFFDITPCRKTRVDICRVCLMACLFSGVFLFIGSSITTKTMLNKIQEICPSKREVIIPIFLSSFWTKPVVAGLVPSSPHPPAPPDAIRSFFFIARRVSAFPLPVDFHIFFIGM